MADGVLSDAYYPTIESSNVKTLQYIVPDGKTFADLQERDMTYTVSSPDRSGTVCQVTSTDARHGFQAVAGSDGSFHAVVPTPPGQSILTVTVTDWGDAAGVGWVDERGEQRDPASGGGRL